MKNFLLGVMSTIIFGPIVKAVLVKVANDLEEKKQSDKTVA